MFIWYEKLTDQQLLDHTKNTPPIKNGRGRNYYEILTECCGFDIETTTIHKPEYDRAYMYIWSFTFNDITILGSYWADFISLLDRLSEVLDLNEKRRLLVFIANMSFEFQFMRKWLNVTNSFFVDERKPLYIIHNERIEFRDALQITGGRLEDLARSYTKTQKLVGELDYTKLRNHTDAHNMTSNELQYVINDTVILSEYANYYFLKFGDSKLPLTKTGILRHAVKQRALSACKRQKMRLSNIIEMNYPHEQLYMYMMKYLFRGGYVHGTNETAGVLLSDCDMSGADITSSYPAHMNLENGYPMGKFIKQKENMPFEEYEELNAEFCTMAIIDFYNISTTTAHSIESNNKVIKSINACCDNGRILDADYIRVFLTNIDFKIYKLFYQWEDIKILKVWTAKRGSLPRYLLEELNANYIHKSKLKRAGLSKTKDYVLSKSNVNSAYGLTVTRMRQNRIIYNNATDNYELDNSFVFSEEVKKQTLLPQWGIWVTAFARYTLLKMVYDIEADNGSNNHDNASICVYMDTDSIKIIDFHKHKHIIEEYNKRREQQVAEMCKKYGYNFEDFSGLGSFEIELPYIKKFKHNGAKRYVYKYYDFKNKEYHIESTIAGLPKKTLINYCDIFHLSIWKAFENTMNIPDDISNKLASIYNDEEHTDIVNGEEMTELSSVALVPIEFTMKIDPKYQLYIEEAKKRKEFNIL